jgi:N-acetyl-gamma-glutamyl-phosphate reductase
MVSAVNGVSVGIYGATGYTGLLLVRLLSNHPATRIVFGTSESSAGQLLSDVFPCPYDLKLIKADDAPLDDVDVAFLCLPHSESMDMVRRVVDAGVKAIDLSADFRLRDVANYEQWYNVKHRAPDLVGRAVYGLPELHRAAIKGAQLVGNPGCYPTSVILGLYPLAANDLLADKTLIADSKSGVSGAGRGLKLSSHFVEVNENFSPYSIGHSHRHIAEMEQELNDTRHGPYQVIFSPHLLPINQGILSTLYVTLPEGIALAEVIDLYRSTYSGEPFVQVLPAGRLATLRHVVGTNRCAISISQVGKTNRFIVVAVIDNLIKGASGQALQNMNLLFGLDEQAGLQL